MDADDRVWLFWSGLTCVSLFLTLILPFTSHFNVALHFAGVVATSLSFGILGIMFSELI